jgi:hypothetical protein
MTQEKTSKIRDIRETISFAGQIMRQIREPQGLESFNKIVDIGTVAKEIIDSLKSPEMVKNIENFRLISQNINESATKIQNVLTQLEGTGIIQVTKELVQSTKNTVDSIGTSQEFHEMGVTIRGVFKSIRTIAAEWNEGRH